MKIRRISAYQVDLPLHEGSYRWSGGKSVSVFDSTIVQVETDAGLWAMARSARWDLFTFPLTRPVCAGIAELGPHLLGEDPTELGRLGRLMDACAQGAPVRQVGHRHGLLGYSAARRRGCPCARCWEAAMETTSCSTGRSRSSRPRRWRRTSPAIARRVIGGSSSRSAAIPTSISPGSARVAGVLEPGDRLVADANTGWLMHEAARVVRAVSDVDVYIEQPCLSYDECLSIRRRTNHPFVMDETIDGIEALLRGHADQAMDVVNLKISKFGGITKLRQARDLCVSLGIAMTIEDSWGGDITTAAIAHLAHSTPTEFLFTATDFNSYVTVRTADGAPRRRERPAWRPRRLLAWA